MNLMHAWETFYVIVGSAGGGLTGLQFVVMSLIAEKRPQTTSEQIGAFGTPTIFHFCVVLAISAIIVAPWPSYSAPAFVIGAIGAAGMVYIGIATKRALKQELYRMVTEDWVWYISLPFVAYGALVATAIDLVFHPAVALDFVAGTSVLLLFIAIHNAWDTVTYVAAMEPASAAGNG